MRLAGRALPRRMGPAQAGAARWQRPCDRPHRYTSLGRASATLGSAEPLCPICPCPHPTALGPPSQSPSVRYPRYSCLQVPVPSLHSRRTHACHQGRSPLSGTGGLSLHPMLFLRPRHSPAVRTAVSQQSPFYRGGKGAAEGGLVAEWGLGPRLLVRLPSPAPAPSHTSVIWGLTEWSCCAQHRSGRGQCQTLTVQVNQAKGTPATLRAWGCLGV